MAANGTDGPIGPPPVEPNASDNRAQPWTQHTSDEESDDLERGGINMVGDAGEHALQNGPPSSAKASSEKAPTIQAAGGSERPVNGRKGSQRPSLKPSSTQVMPAPLHATAISQTVRRHSTGSIGAQRRRRDSTTFLEDVGHAVSQGLRHSIDDGDATSTFF